MPAANAIGSGFTCQCLQFEHGCPVSGGSSLADLAKQSRTRFALEYARGAVEVSRMLADHEFLRRGDQLRDGIELRQRLGILDKGHE